jgi:pantothenate synthetase
MSTRNQYLNADEYRIASKLHKILKQIERGELDLQSATEECVPGKLAVVYTCVRGMHFYRYQT